MQALKERLAEVMTAMRWQHTDLMRVSGQSSSVVSQWLGKSSKEIKTIGKLEAALYIERESGFSALWVAKGLGPKHVPQRSSAAWPVKLGAHVANEPARKYATPETILANLGQLAASLPEDLRDAFADVLAGWVKAGARPDRLRPLLLLLEPQKPQATG